MRAHSDVSFTYVGGHVTRLDIDAGYNGSYVFPKALERLRTASGIHLGLRTTAITAKDPSAEKWGPTHYFIDGPGKACTVLAVITRVVQIVILDGEHKFAGEEPCSAARRELQQADAQPSLTNDDQMNYPGG